MYSRLRREPAMVLVFIFLSCGLYYPYFIYKVSGETRDFLGSAEYEPGLEVLLSLVTCGIWNVYWDYRMGKRMAEMCERAGLPITDNSVLYLVLDLLGFGGFASVGIVNPLLQQETLNRIWQAVDQHGYQNSQDSSAWPPPPNSPSSGPRQPRPPLP